MERKKKVWDKKRQKERIHKGSRVLLESSGDGIQGEESVLLRRGELEAWRREARRHNKSWTYADTCVWRSGCERDLKGGCIAFCMASHGRLGAESPASILSKDLFRLICAYVWSSRQVFSLGGLVREKGKEDAWNENDESSSQEEEEEEVRDYQRYQPDSRCFRLHCSLMRWEEIERLPFEFPRNGAVFPPLYCKERQEIWVRISPEQAAAYSLRDRVWVVEKALPQWTKSSILHRGKIFSFGQSVNEDDKIFDIEKGVLLTKYLPPRPRLAHDDYVQAFIVAQDLMVVLSGRRADCFAEAEYSQIWLIDLSNPESWLPLPPLQLIRTCIFEYRGKLWAAGGLRTVCGTASHPVRSLLSLDLSTPTNSLSWVEEKQLPFEACGFVAWPFRNAVFLGNGGFELYCSGEKRHMPYIPCVIADGSSGANGAFNMTKQKFEAPPTRLGDADLFRQPLQTMRGHCVFVVE